MNEFEYKFSLSETELFSAANTLTKLLLFSNTIVNSPMHNSFNIFFILISSPFYVVIIKYIFYFAPINILSTNSKDFTKINLKYSEVFLIKNPNT